MSLYDIETTTIVSVRDSEHMGMSFGGEMLLYRDLHEVWHDPSQPSPWGYSWSHFIQGRPSSFRRAAPQFDTLEECMKHLCEFARRPRDEFKTDEDIMKEIV